MQMRPEGSRLCLFTSMSLVHVKQKIYKFAVHVTTYQPCAINIPLNTLFCLLQYSSRVLGQKRDRTRALLALYSGESSVAYSMAIA